MKLNYKLNTFQADWLKRIAAAPNGRLKVLGLRQMQSRTRETLRDSGLLLWESRWLIAGRTHTQEVAYEITPKGCEVLRRRAENAALKAKPKEPQRHHLGEGFGYFGDAGG